MQTINEFKKDKKELEDNIKTLLINFEKKYNTIIQDILFSQNVYRDIQGELKSNGITAINIKTEL